MSERFHFPNGLRDFLESHLNGRKTLTPEPFAGEAKFADDEGRVEWAVSWPGDRAFLSAVAKDGNARFA